MTNAISTILQHDNFKVTEEKGNKVCIDTGQTVTKKQIEALEAALCRKLNYIAPYERFGGACWISIEFI